MFNRLILFTCSALILSAPSLHAGKKSLPEAIEKASSLFRANSDFLEDRRQLIQSVKEQFDKQELDRDQALNLLGAKEYGPKNAANLSSYLENFLVAINTNITSQQKLLETLQTLAENDQAAEEKTQAVSNFFSGILNVRQRYLEQRLGNMFLGKDVIPTDPEFLQFPGTDPHQRAISNESINNFWALQKTLELLSPHVKGNLTENDHWLIEADWKLKQSLKSKKSGPTHPDDALISFYNLNFLNYIAPALAPDHFPHLYISTIRSHTWKYQDKTHIWKLSARIGIPNVDELSTQDLEKARAQVQALQKRMGGPGTTIKVPDTIGSISVSPKALFEEINGGLKRAAQKPKKKAAPKPRKKKPAALPKATPTLPTQEVVNLQPVSYTPSPLPAPAGSEPVIHAPKSATEKKPWEGHKDREARKAAFEAVQAKNEPLNDAGEEERPVEIQRPRLSGEALETLRDIYRLHPDTPPTLRLDWDRFVSAWTELRQVVDGEAHPHLISQSGSARKFHGGEPQEGRKSKLRSFVIHEPHASEGHTLGRRSMDRIAEKFQQTFGWTPEKLGL